jgi:hypothetical protein
MLGWARHSLRPARMKRKTPVKLRLNKERIRELSKQSLEKVGGGHCLTTYLKCETQAAAADDD